MSKQVRTTLMILAAVCLISIVCNIWQAASKNSAGAVAAPDTTLVKQHSNDSAKIAQQDATIKKLTAELDALKNKNKNNKENKQ